MRANVVQSINGLSAVIPRGTGKGARSEVNEGLRDRAKVLALHHYFTNHAKYEFE
jgi:hypothetical protein